MVRALSAFALILASFSMLLSVVLFTRITGEGSKRRDGNCRLFESDHREDVKRLAERYRFLVSRPEVSAATVFALQTLRDRESEAKTDVVPKYCDEKGVGLTGKDPIPPPRPKIITKLLVQFDRGPQSLQSRRKP